MGAQYVKDSGKSELVRSMQPSSVAAMEIALEEFLLSLMRPLKQGLDDFRIGYACGLGIDVSSRHRQNCQLNTRRRLRKMTIRSRHLRKMSEEIIGILRLEGIRNALDQRSCKTNKLPFHK